MSDDELRPVEGDAAASTVRREFDLDGQDWWYTAPGDYETAAVEAMKRDGSNRQRLVAMQMPTRKRGTNELARLRVLISPDDALGLAEALTRSACWLAAAEDAEDHSAEDEL